MAYPEDYDDLEGLDLGECSAFSHILTDGIVDTATDAELGQRYCVYAHYGAGDPLVDIIDPRNDELLLSEVAGEWMDNSGLFKFCIDVGADGSLGEGETRWEEKSAILKLYSSESEIRFNKHIGLVSKACTQAEMCDTMDEVIEALETIKQSDVGQDQVLKTLSNGWKVIN